MNTVVIDLEKIKTLPYEKRFLLEIVEEIRQAKGSNEKVEVLRRAAINPQFVEALKLTYSPRIKFYIRQIPEYKPALASAYHIGKVLDMLKEIYLRRVTGNRAIEYLTQLLESSEAIDAEMIKLIVARDLDAGIGVGLINKAMPKLIPEYPVMLCDSFDMPKIESFQYPAFVQPKMDGMRANLVYNKATGAVDLFLRNGNSIDVVPPHLVDIVATEMAPGIGARKGFVLDGELLVLKKIGEPEHLDRKTGNGILTKVLRGTAKAEEVSRVVFVAWDLIEIEAFWEGFYQQSYDARFALLSRVITDSVSLKGVVTILENRIIMNPKQAVEYYEDQIEKGLEGAVVKATSSPWKAGRQKWQVKMKAELDIELKVVAYQEGRGKYVGSLGAFLCESEDGSISVEVGTGLTDEQRRDFWAQNLIGRTITIKYNALIESKGTMKRSLYLPVFIELREDV